MGFDQTIELKMSMCPATGKPFHFGTDPETKKMVRIYTLPDITVPEDLRDYLKQRGHHLRAYMNKVAPPDAYPFETSVEHFLDEYPAWKDVKATESYEGEMFGYAASDEDDGLWNEKDHNNLKRLLEWCVRQQLSFTISWW